MGSHTNGAADETRRVLDAIRRIVQVLRVSSRAAERQVGLSSAQLFVLHKLAEAEATSLNDLAARTATHQSSVSVVVQRLAERGLIDRSASARDARRIELALTAAGRKIVAKSPQAAQERLIAAVRNLAATQRRQLADLLEQVCAATVHGDEPPPMLFEENHKPARRSQRKIHATR
jgi:DNA-binding MarR family transcriptional regulator